MDSLTHAFLVSVVASSTGQAELIPFFILGSVIPDIDILFKHFSDPSPRFYILTHGGLTHSLLGSIIIGLIAFIVVFSLSSLFLVSPMSGVTGILVPLLAVISGAVLHVGVDFLSSPGIPVLYPLSDKKYSLHIFAGPSIFMLFISVIVGSLILLGRAGREDFAIFMGFFIAILAVRSGLKGYITTRIPGHVLPTPHLLKWVIVNDRDTSVEVRRFQFFRGISAVTAFPKFLHTSPEEISHYQHLPEVRRHQFYSYCSVVEKEGAMIVFHDPLREQHYFWYPPSYPSLRLVQGKTR
ncbi:MAG: metal-dependent hydrolase [Methanoregulaceae archaeon]|nr:metal-dependent hydrolase [Methanoregulaceae archaeon]